MSGLDKNFLGLDGFVWFFGIVEDRQDPLGLGRVRVRIYGWHNSGLTDIPSDQLPWAHVVHSANDRAFATPREADMVFGFFTDGRNGQFPVILGIVPGYATNKPDTGSGFHDLRTQAILKLSPKKPTNRTYNTDGSGIVVDEANTADANTLESIRHPNADELDKETISGVTRYQNLANTVIQARKSNLDKDVVTAKSVQWSEPYPAYNPLYPYNQANETESGHVFELDDTPGHERIHIAHRSGSYIEWFPTGTKVEKITKSNYQIVMADDHLHIMGKVLITVDSDALIKVLGDVILEAGNDLSMNVAGDADISVGGALNFKSQSLNFDVDGDASIVSDTQHLTGSSSLDISSGATSISSDGDLNLDSSGDAKLTGISVDIEGPAGVRIDGASVSIMQGAASASAASAGSPSGIPGALGRAQKNTGEASLEDVPVPLQQGLVDFDPETGVAFKQHQFLVPQANGKLGEANTSAAANTPPANTANNPCNFDASSHTFIDDQSLWGIGDAGLSLIKSAEGFAKVVNADTVTSYPDPATGGEPLTIGYGSTAVGIDRPVTLGELISRATAESDLQYSINKKFLPALRQAITVGLTQNMIDACLSLIYNIGPNNFLRSTLRQKINAQLWCDAGDQFLVWNKADGKVLPGLNDRRQKEKSLFLT